jgi:hypothetical protein
MVIPPGKLADTSPLILIVKALFTVILHEDGLGTVYPLIKKYELAGTV